LEIAFRARLLETIGIVSDSSSIENIEIIGRLISSFGFAILFASLIKIKSTNKVLRALTFVVVYSLSFGGFFAAQKFVVESIVTSIPNELKEKAFYLQLYKENVYYGKVKSENFPYTMENKESSQSKVFLANLALLNIDNNAYVDYLMGNKSALIENSVEYGLDASPDAIKYNWFAATDELNGSYDDFEDVQKRINRKVKSINKDSEESFEMIKYYKSEEFRGYRNYILSIYATGGYLSAGSTKSSVDFHAGIKTGRKIYDRSTIYTSVSYDRNGTLNIEKNANQDLLHNEHGVYPRYDLNRYNIKFNEDDVKTEEKLNLFMNKFENSMVLRIHDSLKMELDLIDRKLGYSYSDSVKDTLVSVSKNLCKKYSSVESVKRNTSVSMVYRSDQMIFVVDNGATIYKVETNYETLDGSQFMVCSFDNKKSKLKLVLKDIADKFNKVKFGFNRDYSNPSDFYNTKYFRTMLQNELKYKKMEIPLNFNSKSFREFKKYYTKSIHKNGSKRLTDMVSSFVNMDHMDYIKEYGYVNLNINEKKLYELPAVKKELKARLPFLFDDNGRFIHMYRTNDFNIGSYKDKLPTVKNNFAREQKKFLNNFAKAPIENQEVLDNYGKALVVPPFVLLVSTIMIVVNLVNLFWRVVTIKNIKVKLATNVLFFSLIVFFPLSFSNEYVETQYYERLVGNGTPSSYVLTIVWLQNTNVLFDKSYSVGKVFNPIIDLFEYEFLLENRKDGDTRVRKNNLYKRIKNKE